MSETQQDARDGVTDAVRDLSENTKILVRREIEAAELEMLDKAKQALPAIGLLGAAGFFGVLSLAASYRLSVRLLEKTMPPATAAFVAAAGYGAVAGASGAVGIQRLRSAEPPVPAETVRTTAKAAAGKAKAVADTAKTAATDTAKRAAAGTTAKTAADKAKATAETAAKKATETAKKATETAKKTTETAAKKATETAKKAADSAKAAAADTAKKATDPLAGQPAEMAEQPEISLRQPGMSPD
jgi:flagellar biosynthesis GTPase FlhF